MKRRSKPIRSRISAGGRDQFSELKEKIVRMPMPSSPAARTVRRSASTPRRWPSLRGRPRAAAQRPLPSMMMATWRGTSKSELPSSEIWQRHRLGPFEPVRGRSQSQDFLFLAREHLPPRPPRRPPHPHPGGRTPRRPCARAAVRRARAEPPPTPSAVALPRHRRRRPRSPAPDTRAGRARAPGRARPPTSSPSASRAARRRS